MTEAEAPFDLEFIKTIEEIDFPSSIWRYLLDKMNITENILDDLKKHGYTKEFVLAQLAAIKQLSTEFLIRVFLTDEVAAEAACGALQIRHSESDKDRAIELVHSAVSRERLLGVRMLAYKLGSTFETETIAALHALALSETDDDVLEYICYALYQLADGDQVFYVKHLVGHTNPNVRYAVSVCCFGSEDRDAIDVLVALARDQDDNVRNWAVTGLAAAVSQSDDVEALADLKGVFVEKLSDKNRFTRLEAIDALAQFKDKNKQALEVLASELNAEDVPLLAINAARAFADPSLSPILEKQLQIVGQDDPLRTDIEKAIVACSQI